MISEENDSVVTMGLISGNKRDGSSINQLSSGNLSFPIDPSFNVRLDDTNYLIWREQLKHVLTFYGLQNFLDGYVISPSKFVKPTVTTLNKGTGETRSGEITEENHDYAVWDKEDNAIKNSIGCKA